MKKYVQQVSVTRYCFLVFLIDRARLDLVCARLKFHIAITEQIFNMFPI